MENIETFTEQELKKKMFQDVFAANGASDIY